MADARVGMFALGGHTTAGGVVQRRDALARVVDAGIDHACMGNHVSFLVGAGSDGLIAAASASPSAVRTGTRSRSAASIPARAGAG